MFLSKCKNILIIGLIVIIIIDRLPQANYLLPYLIISLISYYLYQIFLYYHHKANKDQAWMIKIIQQQFQKISNKLGIFWGLKTTTTLILGLDGIGKKSLIANNYTKITSDAPQASITWWYSDKHLLCVAAPRINNTQTAQYSSKLWDVINKKLKFLRFKSHSFDQILITLHIPALQQPHEAQQARDIDQINTALDVILKYNKNTPIKLIFTQADYIQGFKETFAQLNREQIQSLWGFNFQPSYQLGFNQWLNQLNSDLFQYLFQNNQIQAKNKIIDFPSQLMQLKQPIANLLAQLYLPKSNQLTNILFCSSYQSNTEFDYLNNKLFKPSINNMSHTPTFSYSLTTITAKINNNKYKTIYIISLLSLLSIGIMSYIISATNQLQYQPNIPQTNNPWSKSIILKKALDNNKLSAFINSKSYQQLELEYQANLQTIIKTINHQIITALASEQQQVIANTLVITQILTTNNLKPDAIAQVNNWLITYNQDLLQSNAMLLPIINNIIITFNLSPSAKNAIKIAKTKLQQLPENIKIALQAIATHQQPKVLPGTHFLVKSAFTPQLIEIISTKTIPSLCKTNTCNILAKEFYYRAYIDYWYNLLQQPKALLQDITSPELIQDFLHTVQANLKAIYLVSNDVKVITKMYQQWQDLINNTNQLILHPETFTTQDVDNAHINNNLTTKWQHQIQQQISESVSKNLKQTIQAKWTTQVAQKFTNIQQLYPFNSQAKNTISIEQFNELFEPNNLVDSFISQTIKPLIVFQNNQWQNKANSLIKFNQNLLDQLTLYTWIQNTFFQNNKLLIRFNLIPTKMPNTIKQVEINLDQQLVKLFTGNEPAITSKWPFTQNQTTSIKVIDTANQVHLVSFQDAWGLFKLLTTAKIKTTNSSKELHINIPIDNYNLTYKLITETPTNPLILLHSLNLLKFDIKIY